METKIQEQAVSGEPHIWRYEMSSGITGYKLQIVGSSMTYTRYFADSKYADSEAALDAARITRSDILRKLNQPANNKDLFAVIF